MSGVCPGTHRLERLHTGEERDPAVEAHVRDCPACLRQLEELQNDESFLQQRLPPRALAERAAERAGLAGRAGRRRFSLVGLLRFGTPIAAVVALLVAVFVLRGRGEAPTGSTTDRVTLKGSGAAELYLERDGQAVPAASGDVFRAGDRLRLRLVTPPEGQLFVFSVDETGALFPAVAGPDHTGLRVPSGAAFDVPGSVVLDDSPATERLFAVIVPSARPWGEIAAALQRGPLARGADPENLETAGVEDALYETSFLLRKR